jgi:3D (Asp-Asp-Asp) domain-containing protein
MAGIDDDQRAAGQVVVWPDLGCGSVLLHLGGTRVCDGRSHRLSGLRSMVRRYGMTPVRSMAVDREWIRSARPCGSTPRIPWNGSPLQRLMLAQDVGGAIRGPNRGDVFFGWGAEAEARAGRMAQRGRLFVLLPRPVAR